jgi:hypothetical protein
VGGTLGPDRRPLFGSNSTTGVTGFAFGVADMLEVAADPELALPQ